MNPFTIDWWVWNGPALVLVAISAIVWAVVHEVVKAGIKKLLRIPYK